jgi:site-specific DNA recombinase
MAVSPVVRAYLRLSKDSAGAADTIDAQREAVEAFAAAEGRPLVVYDEGAGVSAYAASGRDRVQLERLLGDLQPGDIVWSRHTDRVSRDAAFGLDVLTRRILGQGADLVTAWDGVDTRRDRSTLGIGIRMLVAQEESEEKSRRVTSKKTRDRDAGKLVSGTAPFGLRRREDGKVEPDPATAGVAREALDLALSGAPLRQVVLFLEGKGQRTTRGNYWGVSAVRKWLLSPVLAGLQVQGGKLYRTPDGDTVSVGEGLLKESEHYRLVAAIEGTGPRRGRRPTSYLGGLIKCASCGAPMSFDYSRGRGGSYRCMGYARANGDPPCSTPAFVQGGDVVPLVEALVLGRLSRLVRLLDPNDEGPDPDGLDVGLLNAIGERWEAEQAPAVKSRRAELVASVEDLRARLAKLEDDHYLGDLPADAYRRLRARLEPSLVALETELRTLPAPGPDVERLRSLVEDFPSLPEADRRGIVRLIVDRVEVVPRARRHARFTPELVRIIPAGVTSVT